MPKLGMEPIRREALVQAAARILPALARRAPLPDGPHGGNHERLHELQPLQLGLREAACPPADDQHQRAVLGDVREKVHFVLQMRALAVLPVILAGAKPIGQLVAEPAQAGLFRFQCKFAQSKAQVFFLCKKEFERMSGSNISSCFHAYPFILNKFFLNGNALR